MAVARCPYPHARIVVHRRQPRPGARGRLEVLVARRRRSAAPSRSRCCARCPRRRAVMPYALAARRSPSTRASPVVSRRARPAAHVAEDAVGAIDVDYEPLPHVSDVREALAPRTRPILHPEHGHEPAGAATRAATATPRPARRVRGRRRGPLPHQPRQRPADGDARDRRRRVAPGARELEVVATPPRRRTCSASSSPQSLRIARGRHPRHRPRRRRRLRPQARRSIAEDVLACLHAMDLGAR